MASQSLDFGNAELPLLTDRICPNCGHAGLSLFYEANDVPVHSCLMMSTRQEALDFPCGDVKLCFCDRCGFITNIVFDSQWSAYAPTYESQQSFSPTFNQFANDLAQQLIEKYDLHQKDIVEIGCGKGDFLLLLCELGNNRGVGIDPGVLPGRVQSQAAGQVKFIQDYYSADRADCVGDFVCCRHTLEHIQPTAEFIQIVRKSIGNRLDTNVFFEVPDTIRVLEDLAFEDIYYEHCSYFTPGSLARLFRACGFEVTDLYRAYDNQYLLIEARPVAGQSDRVHPLEEEAEPLAQAVQDFAARIGQKLEWWQQQLQRWQEQGQRVVVWGSGSKCVSFLTTLGTQDRVQYIIDINPHRHGKFIPGIGKEIRAPEFLKQYQADRLIVMNPIYCEEIQQMLNEMGVDVEMIPFV